ncbi:hypothetical protein PFISCL1PPCAC_15896, partial [Pristionchus fissidentatus]
AGTFMGRPGRVKSKGSEASASQDGDTPKTNKAGKRGQGRPRKSHVPDEVVVLDSPPGSRGSSPFSPVNTRALKRRKTKAEARLTSIITDFDQDEDFRSHRLARFLAEHPESREEYLKLIEERSQFPPWITEEEEIEHDGTVYSVGDIVCLFDVDDDLPYFAQIREMINDQFKRPFAWITWLAPSRAAEYAHEFDAEHFVHALIDNKLYPLESLRWECERPDEEAYQIVDDHRSILDKHRLAGLRERAIDLFKAARMEAPKGVELIRAGDVKLAHTKEHKEMLDKVLERAQERDIARRAELKRKEEMGDEEKAKKEEEKEKEKEKDEGDVMRLSSLQLNRGSMLSPSVDELMEESAAEDKKSRGGGRDRTASSQTSSTELNEKPMEE